MASKKCGIFCVESKWKTDEGEVAAKPVLETLRQYHQVPFKSISFATGDEFLSCLTRWTEANDTFRVLYIWSHGIPGGIWAPEGEPARTSVRLIQMADHLEHLNVQSSGCLAHFGSCSTLKMAGSELRDFRTRTGFDAVSGYRRDVGWIKPLAFDLLYLDHVISKASNGGELSAEFMEEVHGDLRERSWYGLGQALRFDIDTGL